MNAIRKEKVESLEVQKVNGYLASLGLDKLYVAETKFHYNSGFKLNRIDGKRKTPREMEQLRILGFHCHYYYKNAAATGWEWSPK